MPHLAVRYKLDCCNVGLSGGHTNRQQTLLPDSNTFSEYGPNSPNLTMSCILQSHQAAPRSKLARLRGSKPGYPVGFNVLFALNVWVQPPRGIRMCQTIRINPTETLAALIYAFVGAFMRDPTDKNHSEATRLAQATYVCLR